MSVLEGFLSDQGAHSPGYYGIHGVPDERKQRLGQTPQIDLKAACRDEMVKPIRLMSVQDLRCADVSLKQVTRFSHAPHGHF